MILSSTNNGYLVGGDACSVLNVNQSFFSTAAGYSMLQPNKRVVGVTIDLEREEDAVLDEETSIPANILEENEVSLDIEEFLEDNTPTFDSTVDVTGKQKHKATVIRELFNESGSSLDRLRCVRTYSKFPDANSNDREDLMAGEVELDSMIMLGDHVSG